MSNAHTIEGSHWNTTRVNEICDGGGGQTGAICENARWRVPHARLQLQLQALHVLQPALHASPASRACLLLLCAA